MIDSDSERRFSVILENDDAVLKWFKSGKGDFQIHYSQDADYQPDFVVATRTTRYLFEAKGGWGVPDENVEKMAKAAALWCQHVTAHDGKPWKYLLIPHDKIDESKTLAGPAAGFEGLPE
jgi:type III restriction enzyme